MVDSIRTVELHSMMLSVCTVLGIQESQPPFDPELGLRVWHPRYSPTARPIERESFLEPEGDSGNPNYELFGTGVFGLGWGRNGLYYEALRNNFVQDVFGQEIINRAPGSKIHNLPQLMLAISEDLQYSFDLRGMSANYIPNADLSGKYCKVEGLYSVVSESLFNLSSINADTKRTFISSLVTQNNTLELMKITGLETVYKSISFEIQGETLADLPVLGFSLTAPTQFLQTTWILQNIAPILTATLKTIN